MNIILRSATLAIIIVVLTTGTACSQTANQAKPSAVKSNSESNLPVTNEVPNLPKPSGFVNDYAEILDDDSENQFESVLSELHTKAKIDFALAIIRSTNGENIFDYSLEVAKDWKIGSENGGLLLVVAIDDRTWFIQIDKRLEQNLSNAEVKQIGDTMIPFFKDKKYDDGLRKCVETMIEGLAEKQKFDPVKF